MSRVRLGPPAGSRAYRLTGRGAELEPVLLALARWGSKVPLDADVAAELSVDALALAMRTTFDASGAADVTCAIHFGDDVLTVAVHAGRLAVSRGAPADPDAVVVTDVGNLRAVLFAGRSPDSLEIAGDRAAAHRLLGRFPRPRAA